MIDRSLTLGSDAVLSKSDRRRIGIHRKNLLKDKLFGKSCFIAKSILGEDLGLEVVYGRCRWPKKEAVGKERAVGNGRDM